jgi:hypothetical protein
MSAKVDSWAKKNARRVALIHKEIAGKLSKDEERELRELQDLADARVEAVLDRMKIKQKFPLGDHVELDGSFGALSGLKGTVDKVYRHPIDQKPTYEIILDRGGIVAASQVNLIRNRRPHAHHL